MRTFVRLVRPAILLVVIGLPSLAEAGSDSGTYYMNFPREMNRAYDVPGNRRFEADGSKGFVVTDNEDSPFNKAAVIWRSSKVIQLDENGNDAELLYEWAVIEIKDADGDMVFMFGDRKEGQEQSSRFIQGSGKYKGIVGNGDLGWDTVTEYPDGSVTRAYSMDWEISDNPDYGLPVPQEGDNYTHVTWIYRYPHELDEDYENKDESRFDHHDEEGFMMSFDDPDSPFHDTQVFANTSILFAPEGDFSDGLLFQWAICELTDTDGDQMFMFGQRGTGGRTALWITGATGKFVGLRAVFDGFSDDFKGWPSTWPGEPEVNPMPFYWAFDK